MMDISDLPKPPRGDASGEATIDISDLPKPPKSVQMPPPEAMPGIYALSAGVGALKPLAGLAQYFGFNKPAETLEEASKRLEQIGGLPSTVINIGGQIMSPVPIKGGQLIGAGVQKVAPAVTRGVEASPLAKAALQGAGAAALNPVTEGDFYEKKPQEIVEGAVIGGGLGKAAQALMAPRVSPAVQELKDMGMTYFTPGQLASQVPLVGESLRKMESAATSIPMAGAFIERGTRKVHEDFNKAIANRVLEPMGEKVPKNVKPGEEMIEYVNNRIEDAYETIAPKLQISNVRYPDPASPAGFTTTIKSLNDKAADVSRGLPSAPGNDLAGMVRTEFDKYILTPLSKGSMTGQEFREAEKNLGRVAFNYMRNPQYYSVGVALRDLQADLRKELSLQNPALANELQGIHMAFRRHLPMERAASYVGAEGRVFSPSQLESAIKATTAGKGRFASGQSLLYPESQAALEVLGKKIPDSGTAQRVMTASGVATLPFHYQASLPATAGVAGLYNVPAMKAMTKLATERPKMMRQAEPAVSGALSGLGGIIGP